jgi:hypothetical protein
MATVYQLLRSGDIERYQLPQWETREPIRELYGIPELFDWVMENPIMQDESDKKGGKDRLEHLQALFSEFRCDKQPGGGNLRRVNPSGEGVFKLQPYGARVFGVFIEPKVFIGVCAIVSEEGHGKNAKQTYTEMRTQVLNFVKKHNLQDEILKGEIYEVLGTKA